MYHFFFPLSLVVIGLFLIYFYRVNQEVAHVPESL